jgi:hypothetical protein
MWLMIILGLILNWLCLFPTSEIFLYYFGMFSFFSKKIWTKKNSQHVVFVVRPYVATLALGSWPRQRLARVRAKRVYPRVTSHAPKNVGKCEGMNLHTPKWAPTLGVGVPMDSQIFREQWQGSKPIRLMNYLYHWKALGT